MRDLLVELEVVRRDDDAHAADAEHPLDAVLAREDVPFAHRGRRVRTALHQPMAPPRRRLGGKLPELARFVYT